MTSPPVLVVVISGSVPRRPTRVKRASWDDREVLNARLGAETVESDTRDALRRGNRSKDISGGRRQFLGRG